MSELFRRLYYLLNRSRIEKELADEMAYHRELSIDGGSDARQFGDTLRLREEARDAWGWTWVDRTIQDVRYAFRTMRRTPWSTLAAVVTLAIGIGANLAAFAFFNIVMLQPMPVKDPETLVRLHRIAPGQYSSDMPYPAMEFYRQHSRTLSAVLALDEGRLNDEHGAAPVSANFVTSNFFSELGGRAAIGRLLDARRDEGPDAERVVVLGHKYWQTRFGGDPSVVGTRMRMNGKPVLVIGVVARDFSGLIFNLPDVWMSITQQPYLVEGSKLLLSLSADEDGVDVWGRLRTGVSPSAAEEELRILTGQLRKQHPIEIWENESLLVRPGGYAQKAGGKERATAPSGDFRSRLYPVFAMIGALTLLILAVTCGNVGSMLLARGVSREREISIRRAVGAGKGRLIRQLLTESLVLAVVGSGAALLLGHFVLDRMLVWTGAPEWLDLTPDWRVAGFTIVLAAVASIMFGLTPALQVVQSFRRVTVARQVLISAQVAASCILLITAGVLIRAINHALSVSPGFEYKQVVSIDPRLHVHGYAETAARDYFRGLQEELRSLPGVESVSLSSTPPLGNRRTTLGGEKDGRTFAIYVNKVDPEFFHTMKIALLRGRTFRPDEAGPVVVSESLARSLWPGEDPLEKQFVAGTDKHQVIGVVGNARANALADEHAVEVYELLGSQELASASVLVRVAGPVEGLLENISKTARSRDPNLVPAIRTLRSAFAGKLEETERSAAAVGVLGGVASLLSCLGIAGVVSFSVSQRVKDIGIRMALGAMPSDVMAVVTRQFWPAIVAGLGAGALGALALSQFLRGQLVGVASMDPIAYAAAAGVLGLTAAIAVFVPAKRALRVDPMRALRSE